MPCACGFARLEYIVRNELMLNPSLHCWRDSRQHPHRTAPRNWAMRFCQSSLSSAPYTIMVNVPSFTSRALLFTAHTQAERNQEKRSQLTQV